MPEESNPVYTNKDHGQSRELFYFYEEGGDFEKRVGYHPNQDRVILQQAWDLFRERIEDARKKVLAGETSPVVYYMEKNLLDPMNLSMIAGIAIWRVKRHFKPNVFKRLGEKVLDKYARAFNISREQLINIELK
jgi:hypothetical protein